MAIINKEKVLQMKNEQAIKLSAINEQREMWAKGILNQFSQVRESVIDILDTYSYFVKNRLPLNVFKVDEVHIKLSVSDRYVYCGLYKDEISSYAKYYVEENNIVAGANFYGMCEIYRLLKNDYHTKQLYKEKHYKPMLEQFAEDITIYAKIVTDRLSKL